MRRAMRRAKSEVPFALLWPPAWVSKSGAGFVPWSISSCFTPDRTQHINHTKSNPTASSAFHKPSLLCEPNFKLAPFFRNSTRHCCTPPSLWPTPANHSKSSWLRRLMTGKFLKKKTCSQKKGIVAKNALCSGQ